MILSYQPYVGEFDESVIVLLNLSVSRAEKYLQYRDLAQLCESAISDFSSLRIRNWDPDVCEFAYYTLDEPTVDEEMLAWFSDQISNSGLWVVFPDVFSSRKGEDVRLSSSLMIVSRSGVSWEFFPKYGSDMSTDELTWDQLAAVTQGECPFDVYPPPQFAGPGETI